MKFEKYLKNTYKTGKLPTSNAARAGLGLGIMAAYTSFTAGRSRTSIYQLTLSFPFHFDLPLHVLLSPSKGSNRTKP